MASSFTRRSLVALLPAAHLAAAGRKPSLQQLDLFHQGETIARAGDRIFVLADHHEIVEQRAEILADRLRLDAATRRSRATVVIDQLPRPELLERYVRDLVG